MFNVVYGVPLVYDEVHLVLFMIVGKNTAIRLRR